MPHKFVNRSRKGTTLFETLIVLTVFIIMATAGFTLWLTQMKRAHDARKKEDLHKISAALENYINDHGCYPDQAFMGSCGGGQLSSYNILRMPCETPGKPYYYEPIDSMDLCKGYRMYTSLGDKYDPDIAKLGCDGPAGCGVTGHPEYNYGVAAGASVKK